MAAQDLQLDPLLLVGVVLLAILFHTCIFGIVSQQLYEYSLSRFKDSMRIKIFICAQYAVIVCQSIILWQLAWSYFVVDYGIVKARTWQVCAGLGCQCILVLSANIFLADRIHTLTRSRLMSAVIITLSIGAFGFGVATITLIYFGHLTSGGGLTRPQIILSAFWHGFQAIAECLITYSLIRGLLNSRTGIQKSGCVAHYLVRRVVQIGLFAAIWTILGLLAFVFMPKVCSLFDMTVGSIYTHVIFDTLQSRHRLAENTLAESNHFDMALTAQSPPRNVDGKRASGSPGTAHNNVSVLVMAGLENPQSTFRLSRDNVSEIECAPTGQPGVPYEFSYARFLGEF